MVTIKQISEELHISPATVSRALNGFPEVSEKTRALVEDTARRLNYRPNQLAKKLVTGRSGMVGLVLRSTDELAIDPTLYDVIAGLSSRLAHHDMDIVFHAAANDDPVEPYRRLFAKQIIDGFIVNAPAVNDPRIAYLRSKRAVFVVHGRDVGDSADYPYVDIDNARAARDAASLLLDLGHRRIALLNGPKTLSYAAERTRGFTQALEARGLEPFVPAISYESLTESYGYRAALSMLSWVDRPAPTAFVCASTLVASGVYKALADKGLRAGGDVSVVAHDDAVPQLRAVNFEPALTVTRSPLRDACGPLADFLYARLEGAAIDTLQRTSIAELIVRNSTAPVATGGDMAW